jgi:hypothetical protein
MEPLKTRELTRVPWPDRELSCTATMTTGALSAS